MRWSDRASALIGLAVHVPKNRLPEIYQIITEITHAPTRAKALAGYLPHLPLTQLPYPDWQTHLHLLAHRKRAELIQDLLMLYPAIQALGGAGAMRRVVDEMGRVCGQWK